MLKNFWKFRIHIVFLILPLLIAAGCAKVDRKIAIGEKLPDFEVVQLSGSNRNLSSLSKGQVSLVIFWATWCSRCREEVSFINELTTHYGSSLAVIGISAGESIQTVKAHATGLGIRYPVFVTELSNFAKLGVESIPRLAVLDSKGRVRQIENGVNAVLRTSLRQLLGELDSR